MYKKIGIFILIILIAGGLFFLVKNTSLTKPNNPQTPSEAKTNQPSQVSQTDKPQIVSTKPDPLDENIVTAAEIIEITFNRPLENVGEFKSRIEPEIEYKVELSGDRKTAKIIPAKPYPLGTGYTLFVKPDTKFDGVGNWGEEKVFHFRTIKYSGV